MSTSKINSSDKESDKESNKQSDKESEEEEEDKKVEDEEYEEEEEEQYEEDEEEEEEEQEEECPNCHKTEFIQFDKSLFLCKNCQPNNKGYFKCKNCEAVMCSSCNNLQYIDTLCGKHCDLFKFKPFYKDEEDAIRYIIGQYDIINCLYCVLETGDRDEQWDGATAWQAISSYVTELIYTGYCDYISGITNFLDTCEPIKKGGDINGIRNYYRLGQQLASKNNNCGNELWDCCGIRAFGCQDDGIITTRDSKKEYNRWSKKPYEISEKMKNRLPPHLIILENMKNSSL